MIRSLSLRAAALLAAAACLSAAAPASRAPPADPSMASPPHTELKGYLGPKAAGVRASV